MGIQGLLPFLKPIVRRTGIEEFKGKTVGVDAMCWMHKGAFACSQELVRGVDTNRFIYFFLRHCEILRFHQIKPVIVFDGARLPAKAKEESERQDRRERNRQQALELIERKERGEAVDERDLASKCEGAIKVTSEMISRLMTALRELNIHFIVAPYEADAQLAYMCRRGWVHAAISEDSDLLAYGCPNTFFKMDKYGNGENIVLPCLQPDAQQPPATEEDMLDEEPPDDEGEHAAAADGAGDAAGDEAGNGAGDCEAGASEAGNGECHGPQEVETAASTSARSGRGQRRGRGRGNQSGRGRGRGKERAQAAKEVREGLDDPLMRLRSWTSEKFTEFCVLLGTDYKEHDVHIKGLGGKTAFQLLSRFRTTERMLTWMRRDKRWKDKFPCGVEDYMTRFRNIVGVFWHHRVFDPRRGECVSIALAFPLADRSLSGVNLEELCGICAAKEHAARVAKGELDPRTFKERSQEPLTPAERRALDDIIARKRSEQHQYRFEQQLRADAAAQAAAAAERAARAAASGAPAAVASGSAAAVGTAPAAAAVPSDFDGDLPPPAEAPDDDEDEENKPPPEMTLFHSDVKAIFSLMEGKRSSDTGASQTPPRTAGQASVTTSDRAASTPANHNPFARKRASAPVSTGSKEPPKKIRVLGPRSNTLAARGPALAKVRVTREPPEPVRRTSEPARVPAEAPRQVEMPEHHPRGGSAAEMAADAVLAQKGLPNLEQVDPSKDRNKLTSFFKSAPAAKRATGRILPGSALSNWRARPWEEATQEAPASAVPNPLSLVSNQCRGNLYIRRGW
mmetsp:Transcript_61002/g.111774  ORF Transcript_61002/g.111774 Transcript_61002/m.111774 type:complete len:796 (+) Transcript_61002:71-2458(+)